MRWIDSELYISLFEIKKLGLYGTFRNWKSDGIIQIIGDAENIEILVSSIPERSRKRILEQLTPAQKLVENKQDFPEMIAAVFNQGYKDYLLLYKENLTTVKNELAKAHAIIQVFVDFLKAQKLDSKESNALIKKYWECLQDNKKVQDLKYLKTGSLNVFMYRTIPNALENGIQMKQPRLGIQNNKKYSDFHLYLVKYLYANPVQYSKIQVFEMANYIIRALEFDVPYRDEKAFELLNPKSISKIISREVENELALFRQGVYAFNTLHKGYLSRIAPLNAGDVWVIDGTRIQRMYKNPQGKIRFAYRVFVIDAFSKMIIGICILPAGQSENAEAVRKALKMAYETVGYLPAELLSDNFGKNAENDAQWESLGTRVRHSKVGNARDKIIERIIGTVQTRCDKLYPNNVGEGVKSRSKNAHPAPEHIKAVTEKKGLIPDFEGLIKQELEEILLYNTVQWNKKFSCKDVFLKSEPINAVRPNEIEIASLLWNETEKDVLSRQVTIQVNGEKREYPIYAHEDAVKWNLSKVIIKFCEKNKEKVFIFSKNGQFICESRHKILVHGALVNQTEVDKVQILAQTSHLNSYETFLKNRQNDLKKRAGEEFENKMVAKVMAETGCDEIAAKDTVEGMELEGDIVSIAPNMYRKQLVQEAELQVMYEQFGLDSEVCIDSENQTYLTMSEPKTAKRRENKKDKAFLNTDGDMSNLGSF